MYISTGIHANTCVRVSAVVSWGACALFCTKCMSQARWAAHVQAAALQNTTIGNRRQALFFFNCEGGARRRLALSLAEWTVAVAVPWSPEAPHNM